MIFCLPSFFSYFLLYSHSASFIFFVPFFALEAEVSTPESSTANNAYGAPVGANEWLFAGSAYFFGLLL